MGTLGQATRKRRTAKPAKETHPALAKLAVALKEHKQALEQQAATAEILQAISRSPGKAQPVFETILDKAHRLCGAAYTVLYGYDGETIDVLGSRGMTAKGMRVLRSNYPQKPSRDKLIGRAVLEAKVFHTDDINKDPRFPSATKALPRRTVIAVPLVRGHKVLGAISCGRVETRAFSKKEIWLLRTFADQAVIAIENARLFNETKEALEHQTAISEILEQISGSPTDVGPVLRAVAERAARLCEGEQATVLMLEDGNVLRPRVTYSTDKGPLPNPETRVYLDRGYITGRAALDGVAINVEDAAELAGTEYRAGSENQQKLGYRSFLAAPMMREGKAIGVIAVWRRFVRRFSEKHVALVKTFADQAAIAIENVRLFNETKEALDQQTATGEILKVISSSPTDHQPVFETIVQSSKRLLAGHSATAVRLVDGMLQLAAYTPVNPTADEELKRFYPRPLDGSSAVSMVALERKPFFWSDVQNDPRVPAAAREVARKRGYRSNLIVPMLRLGETIGALVVSRRNPGPFSEADIALLQTFADQAVIAIENVRLFNETKEALEQQTAISEVLRVISSSPADVKPVLDAVAARAARICEASDARIFLVDGESLRHTAGFGDVPISIKIGETVPLDRGVVTGRSILDRAPLHIEDTEKLDADEFPITKGTAGRSGFRTMLVVPLLRENRALGAILLRRMEVKPFTDKQVALLQTFADQAAIAIENVRLFNATQEALEQQTATSEVLNVISGSITDARPAFDAISRSVLRLYGARTVSLVVRVGERIDRVGYALADRSADDGSQALWPIPLDDGSLSGRAILGGELVHIKDVDTEPGLSEHSRVITQRTGVRSALVAPMYSMGSAIGALAVGRRAPGGFSEREVEMIRTFADQAVIAMENVRLFREIQEKSAQLEVASQHKSQFLASMSHELRTPLNALLGFNEMLLGDIYGEVPGDMRPPLAQMQSSGKHLLRLINNVLDLAKIEAGRMELALAEYSVYDTVESVRSTLQPLAAEKGLEFLAAVPAEIPLAYGDPGRITQCLLNLAGNSLKFTRAGKVEISVAMNDGLLCYRVADTGIGIPADKIEGLFTEFKQTDATVASEYGGTGLGLSISKKFVEMHGGRIWAESDPGKGSVFTFEIPLRASAP